MRSHLPPKMPILARVRLAVLWPTFRTLVAQVEFYYSQLKKTGDSRGCIKNRIRHMLHTYQCSIRMFYRLPDRHQVSSSGIFSTSNFYGPPEAFPFWTILLLNRQIDIRSLKHGDTMIQAAVFDFNGRNIINTGSFLSICSNTYFPSRWSPTEWKNGCRIRHLWYTVPSLRFWWLLLVGNLEITSHQSTSHLSETQFIV